MRAYLPSGVRGQIALAASAVALTALAIVGTGVWLVGGRTFTELMVLHGEEAAVAHEMFDEAVTSILLLALGAALISAVVLAAALGAHIGRPLRRLGAAARRIADGNYDARVPRGGTEETISLADSFNQMAAALERQEQLRRELIANAAHELRTPLTNLQGYLEALRDSVIPPDRQTFESLWEEADRLVRLSRSLDQLAAGDASEAPVRPAEIDLPAIVHAAVKLVRPAAQARRIELATEGPDRLRAKGDPDRLAQVLANLLSNAVDYTPDSGRIRVAWERRPEDVLVSVANTGSQIPEADLPHVFERFYRVEKSRDRARGGAGIGLAIVRQLVEASGGRVGAESSASLTRFWFTIPGTSAGQPG